MDMKIGRTKRGLKRSQVELLRQASNVNRISHKREAYLRASNSPLGQFLENIATLPEIREEKVNELRRRIKEGTYDIDRHIEVTIERAFEDIIC